MDVAPDRCPSCGAELAVDQRYCLECGYRRGKPRYALAPPEPAVPSTPPPPPSGGRFSPGGALLAGLATLLLALGVGVIIGSSGNTGRQPVNVSVAGGPVASAPSAATGAANTSGQRSTGRKTKSGGHHARASSAPKSQPVASKHIAAPTKKLKKAAAIASKHVTSTTGQSSIGSKCAGGAGCHHGKQTGVFFGGG